MQVYVRYDKSEYDMKVELEVPGDVVTATIPFGTKEIWLVRYAACSCGWTSAKMFLTEAEAKLEEEATWRAV